MSKTTIETLKGLDAKFYLVERNHGSDHHIAIVECPGEGTMVFYNQSIRIEALDGKRQDELRGKGVDCERYDFYPEWERVYAGSWHGYRKEIDMAIAMHRKAESEARAAQMDADGPEVNEDVEVYANQGMRPGIVIARLTDNLGGRAALIAYQMPAGRVFLAHYVATGKPGSKDIAGYSTWAWKRSIALRSIPGYWRDAVGRAIDAKGDLMEREEQISAHLYAVTRDNAIA